ncbi:UDP-N-acetylmuramoyl-L-alanyl-D-glutamate--2,6-diaminopimelate ligase [Candidatus Ferrigenium straubiae]|jgi:UDP-N-acetylmuramoyl-L-alanyl-D-glutamate--2,6-diaminopimelate ligase|uniref:UDP-N-acetylmuramoyl-L-alanyl-D-glutamate--2, 6-diaminopimelate ligase n=1 Tax=Candidatus Ferrigenium straubiae TaxID=2919506 RepID=UPI003F4AC071
MFPFDRLRELNVKITRLVTDSRAVRPGDTFVAYPGEKADGRQFIAQAIAQGANAVIYEKLLSGGEAQHFAWNDAWQIPNLAVSDLRHKAGWLADAVYGAPSEKLWLVGVTGTNGKTSTSHWIAHALNDVGKKCALIGTLGNGFVESLQPSANTTPDAIRVHGLLADYLRADAQAVAMEVSSHALAQGRVNGARFDVALLTNLSRDHLDYHGDMESYAASKHKLFDWEQLKYAVLNLDDAFGAELAEQLRDGSAEVIGYGMSDAALQLAERHGLRMVYGNLAEMSGQGLRLDVHTSWGGAQINSRLVGRFNAANLLGVLAVLLASGIELDQAVQSLGRVQAVAGRMQRVGGGGQPTVIVDYAHTPDALEKVLLTLREVGASSGGKLICVFGCGGDRDRGKRAMMGRVAEKFADHCIVTSDNPRSEDPQRIIDEILGGMDMGKHEAVVERAAAIARAVGMARQRDTVLIAGKGHEDYQEIAGVKHPFSDVAVAADALERWRAIP